MCKKFSAFCETQWVTTVFIKACRWSLSQADEFSPSTSFPYDSFLILSSPPYLDLLTCLFLRYPTKTLYSFLFSHIHSTCPTHFIILDLIIIIFGEEYKLWCSALSSFLQTPVMSCLLVQIFSFGHLRPQFDTVRNFFSESALSKYFLLPSLDGSWCYIWQFFGCM
jgi:hypothetical protein